MKSTRHLTETLIYTSGGIMQTILWQENGGDPNLDGERTRPRVPWPAPRRPQKDLRMELLWRIARRTFREVAVVALRQLRPRQSGRNESPAMLRTFIAPLDAALLVAARRVPPAHYPATLRISPI